MHSDDTSERVRALRRIRDLLRHRLRVAKLPSPAPVCLDPEDVVRLHVAAGWWNPPHDLQDAAEQEFAGRLLAGVQEALGLRSTYGTLLSHPIGPTNGEIRQCLETHLKVLKAIDPANWTGTSQKAAGAIHKPPGTFRKAAPWRPSPGLLPRDANGKPSVDTDNSPTVPDILVVGWDTMTDVDAARSEIIRAVPFPRVEFGAGEMAAMWEGEFRNERARAEYMAAAERALDEVSTRDGRGNPPDRVHMALVARLTWVWLWHSKLGRDWREGVGPTPEQQRRWRKLTEAHQLRLQEAEILRKITEFVFVVADIAEITELSERNRETVHGWVAEAVEVWRRTAPKDELLRIDNDQPEQGR